jgi:chromosome segregation ATPase
VVREKEKTVEELRRKLAAHDSPSGRSEREKQFETRIAELRRDVEAGENDARKLRQEKLELEEKLKHRERAWKIEKESLTTGASVSQTHRDRQIEDLKARCFELQTENTELRARCPVGMAAALRLAQERVRTLERQVGELKTQVGGARTGPSVYDLLCDMAECISKMGKDMKEVRFVWLQWWLGDADSPLLCRRPLTANSGCR